MNEKEISATSAALRSELTDRILRKIEIIRSKITEGEGSTKAAYVQMLIMIDEDLDDVLLNWEYDAISSKRFGSLLDDFDEDDDF
jgi:hypothetical protein